MAHIAIRLTSCVADRSGHPFVGLSLDTSAALLRPAPIPAYDVWCTPIVARPGRIDLRVPIVLTFEGERITRETRNIGISGVFVATHEAAPVGKHVSLELTLPHWGEPIVVGGEGRWARTSEEDDPHRDGIPGVGVEFLKPPLYVVAALDNFVRSDAPGT